MRGDVNVVCLLLPRVGEVWMQPLKCTNEQKQSATSRRKLQPWLTMVNNPFSAPYMCGQVVNWFNVHKILIAFKRPQLVSLPLIGRSANEQLCGCFRGEKNKLNVQFSVQCVKQIIFCWPFAWFALMEHWIELLAWWSSAAAIHTCKRWSNH